MDLPFTGGRLFTLHILLTVSKFPVTNFSWLCMLSSRYLMSESTLRYTRYFTRSRSSPEPWARSSSVLSPTTPEARIARIIRGIGTVSIVDAGQDYVMHYKQFGDQHCLADVAGSGCRITGSGCCLHPMDRIQTYRYHAILPFGEICLLRGEQEMFMKRYDPGEYKKPILVKVTHQWSYIIPKDVICELCIQ